MVNITDKYVIAVVTSTFVTLVVLPTVAPCRNCDSEKELAALVWVFIGGPYLFGLIKYFITGIKDEIEELA